VVIVLAALKEARLPEEKGVKLDPLVRMPESFQEWRSTRWEDLWVNNMATLGRSLRRMGAEDADLGSQETLKKAGKGSPLHDPRGIHLSHTSKLSRATRKAWMVTFHLVGSRGDEC